MNWVDLLLVLVVILSVWTGWQKGFIVGFLDLVTWVGSILTGLLFYKHTASFFEKYIPSLGVWIFPVAFILTVIVAWIIFSFITKNLLSATPEEAHRNSANHFLGIIPGAINGVINATIIAALLMAVHLWDGLSAKTRDSKIAGKLAYQAEWVEGKFSPIFDEAIRRSINKLTVEPESEKSIQLHYTVSNPRIREDLEEKMLGMVNEERTKIGLSPLKADPELAQVARVHSRDMFAKGYFSHVTPDGKTLADRVRMAHVSFLTVGENLALGPTLPICHEGLMNSPGHKANILHPSYTRAGIGVLDGGKYGLMITQNFRN